MFDALWNHISNGIKINNVRERAIVYHLITIECLFFLRLLGEGTFGQVYKGRLLKHGDERDMAIAIKVNKLYQGLFF